MIEVLTKSYELSDLMNQGFTNKIEYLEKFRLAYNKRVAKDKKREEKEAKKAKNSEDPALLKARQTNSQLLLEKQQLFEEVNELKNNIDLLLDENMEYERQIDDLKLDLKDKD